MKGFFFIIMNYLKTLLELIDWIFMFFFNSAIDKFLISQLQYLMKEEYNTTSYFLKIFNLIKSILKIKKIILLLSIFLLISFNRISI